MGHMKKIFKHLEIKFTKYIVTKFISQHFTLDKDINSIEFGYCSSFS